LAKLFTNKVLFVACVAAVAVVLAGCDPAEPVANVESGAKKVAVYDGGEITQAELDEQINALAQQSGMEEIPQDSPQYEAAVAQVMPQLVGIELARTYAEENDITVSEEDVDAEIATIKDQIAQQAQAQGQDVGKEEAFQQALEGAGLTEDELRDEIRQTLPLQKVQEEVAGGAEPSEADIETYYEENKEAQFTNPERRCVRHILLNKDQEQKAEEIKSQLEDGGNFEELARENSQDPGSAENGGDLGCIGTGETVPNFEEAAFEAEVGEIVGPVETDFGYHIIEVTEIEERNVTPLDEVSGQISDQLSQERQAAEFQSWIEEQEEKRNLRYLPGYDPEEALQEAAPSPEEAPEGQEQE
jgi:peptidyl-prolyl cis-trans isomerase C